jgi:hypothetical protein
MNEQSILISNISGEWGPVATKIVNDPTLGTTQNPESHRPLVEQSPIDFAKLMTDIDHQMRSHITNLDKLAKQREKSRFTTST